MTRQAMLIEYEGGRREYSPDVEVTPGGDGHWTVTPIVPFQVLPVNENGDDAE